MDLLLRPKGNNAYTSSLYGGDGTISIAHKQQATFNKGQAAGGNRTEQEVGGCAITTRSKNIHKCVTMSFILLKMFSDI